MFFSYFGFQGVVVVFCVDYIFFKCGFIILNFFIVELGFVYFYNCYYCGRKVKGEKRIIIFYLCVKVIKVLNM